MRKLLIFLFILIGSAYSEYVTVIWNSDKAHSSRVNNVYFDQQSAARHDWAKRSRYLNDTLMLMESKGYKLVTAYCQNSGYAMLHFFLFKKTKGISK